MGQALRKTLVLLLIPLVIINWNTIAVAEVAVESSTSYAPIADDSQKDTDITRAEASKMFVVALELPHPSAESVYNDVRSTYWAKDYIAAASKAGLFDGYADGSFRPDETLTEEELTQVLAEALKLQQDANHSIANEQ